MWWQKYWVLYNKDDIAANLTSTAPNTFATKTELIKLALPASRVMTGMSTNTVYSIVSFKGVSLGTAYLTFKLTGSNYNSADHALSINAVCESGSLTAITWSVLVLNKTEANAQAASVSILTPSLMTPSRSSLAGSV